ncbi:MAG: dihydroorotase [Proteobacteria bacterium]|jgi:dihydroorotase|nr:dihydroorotase [Pseudomonadota bacterium]MCG6936096.1 dihydroorotase [Pseudomonadota bacterium]
MTTLTLTRPDDWHLHVRDGAVLQDVVPATARQFARSIIMPNLNPPVTTVEQALAYRDRILAAVPAGISYNPLMTLYLTDNTSADDIRLACAATHLHAVKYYPAGATTNSDAGVTAIEKTWNTLAVMEELELPLLIHGEVTDPHVDVFDREAVFIDTILIPLLQRFPRLRVVLEHITTRAAVEFIQSTNENIAATITAHHLLLNRNAMFMGGIRPHHYCLPILKRESHRRALLEAAISGNPKFFLGTDSAPHAKNAKESACGCAGIYTAPLALELYTEIFDTAGTLDKLEGFASFYGADFYRLPRNTDTITLCRENWTMPETLNFGEEKLVPLRAGETVKWKLVES